MGGNPGVDWALFAKQMDSAMGYGPTPLPPAINQRLRSFRRSDAASTWRMFAWA